MSGSVLISPNDVDTTLLEDAQPDGSILASFIRQMNDSLAGLVTVQKSGTSYTFAAIDRGTLLESTNSSPVVFTIPPNSSVPFQINTIIAFRQYGTGSLSIAGSGSAVLRTATTLIVGTQYLGGYAHKRGTDEWIIVI